MTYEGGRTSPVKDSVLIAILETARMHIVNRDWRGARFYLAWFVRTARDFKADLGDLDFSFDIPDNADSTDQRGSK